MMVALIRQSFARELKLRVRHWIDSLLPIVLFFIILALFPIALGPSAAKLQTQAPGLVWVAIFMVVILNAQQFFRDEWQEEELERMSLSELPLALIVLIKIVVMWVFIAAPLVLCLPVAASFLYLPMDALLVLALTTLIGTLCLVLWSSLATVLTLSTRQGSMLIAAITFPFMAPLMIFAVRTTELAANSEPAMAGLAFIAGYTLLAVCVMPFAIALVLRAALGDR